MRPLVIFLSAAAVAMDAAAPPAPPPGVSASPPTSSAGAPSVRATPWPLVLPCAHPKQIKFGHVAVGEVVWSSADGTIARTFPTGQGARPLSLPPDFPMGRLDRLTGDGVPSNVPSPNDDRAWISLSCANRGLVSWGTCQASTCPPSATYRAGPLPRAARVERWTHPRPSPWGDDALEVHGSLFLNEIAYRKPGDQVRERMAGRFTRDVATDLRQMLAFACTQHRCGPLGAATDAATTSFLRAKDATFTPVAFKRTSRWGRDTSWTATGGGTRLEVGCYDQDESAWVSCWLTVDLPGDLQATYEPATKYARGQHDLTFLRKGDIHEELGAIDLEEASPEASGSYVELSGQALALRP